jgi:hypothetical protein
VSRVLDRLEPGATIREVVARAEQWRRDGYDVAIEVRRDPSPRALIVAECKRAAPLQGLDADYLRATFRDFAARAKTAQEYGRLVEVLIHRATKDPLLRIELYTLAGEVLSAAERLPREVRP